MEVKKNIVQNAGNIFGVGPPPGAAAGAAPQSIATVPITDSDVDYFIRKKEQETYMNDLRLAEYLIDEKNPATQDYAYSLFPELNEVPIEEYESNLAIQAAIWNIFKTGKLEGREDHALVAKIIRGDVPLPIFPGTQLILFTNFINFLFF